MADQKKFTEILKKIFVEDNNKDEYEEEEKQEDKNKDEKTSIQKMKEKERQGAEERRQKRKIEREKKKKQQDKDIVDDRGDLKWINKANKNTLHECYDKNDNKIFEIKRGITIFELIPTDRSIYNRKHFSLNLENLKNKAKKILKQKK